MASSGNPRRAPDEAGTAAAAGAGEEDRSPGFGVSPASGRRASNEVGADPDDGSSEAAPGAACESESEAAPGAARESESEAALGAACESESEAAPGAARESESEAALGAACESESEAAPGAACESESEAAPGAACESESEAGPGAACESESEAARGGLRIGIRGRRRRRSGARGRPVEDDRDSVLRRQGAPPLRPS